MKIVIDIPDDEYQRTMQHYEQFPRDLSRYERRIIDGTPLPDGAEILTKEAYSDLCLRATAYDDLYLQASRSYGGAE